MRILFIVVFAIVNSYASKYSELFFSGNCSSCHFKNTAVSAPSILEIKQRYITAFPKQEDFVNHMSTWVKKPNFKTSLMNDAIKKYEIMPELGFDLDTIKIISLYIYKNNFNTKRP